MNDQRSDVTGRVVLVTGATGAIGRAIAQGLAKRHDWTVVLVGRDQQRTREVTEAISQTTFNPNLRYELADLARPDDIRRLAGRWQGPLHVLINNAAATPRQSQETPEGIELQWATNVLAYLWLVQALRPVLRRSAPARVINVASYYAGDLELSDPEFKRRPYDNNRAYRQSKQANRMLTVALAERLANEGITVNSCHPGDVDSRLSNNLGFGGSETPDQGAATPIWLATAADVARQTGAYYADCQQAACRFASDRTAVEALYQLCLTYGDLTPPAGTDVSR
jgi:retinol dehydrogenase 12